MASPGPRIRSSATFSELHNRFLNETGHAQNQAMAVAVIEATRQAQLVGQAHNGGGPHLSGAAATRFLSGVCGLNCDLATLVARAASLGMKVPGFNAGGVFTHAELPDTIAYGSAQFIRAWALGHAPDLIDPAVVQHPDAVTHWRWW